MLSRRQRPDFEMGQDAQRLGDRNSTGRRERHSAHGPASIVDAHRIALARLVSGQIGLRQAARVTRIGAHRAHHVVGDRAPVKGVGPALGDRAQRLDQGRVAQKGADRQRVALRIIEIRSGGRIVLQSGFALEQFVQSRRDRKTMLGQVDGRLEQRGPLQAPVFAVNALQHPQHAGGSDRQPAGRGVPERQGSPVLADELVLGRFDRGRLPAVIGLHPGATPVQQERPASDAGALRLHQRQNHLHGDRGVDRRAPVAQDLQSGAGCQWIGRRDHVLASGAGALQRSQPGRALRLRVPGRGRRAGAPGQRQAQAQPDCPAGPTSAASEALHPDGSWFR